MAKRKTTRKKARRKTAIRTVAKKRRLLTDEEKDMRRGVKSAIRTQDAETLRKIFIKRISRPRLNRKRGERFVSGLPRGKTGSRFLVIRTSKPEVVIVRKLKRK